MPSVQKIAVVIGVAFLAATLLIKTGVLRPGPDTRSMEERQAAALRVKVEKIRETNAAAQERLAELQRELEEQLAATLALKTEVALLPPDGRAVAVPAAPLSAVAERRASAENAARVVVQIGQSGGPLSRAGETATVALVRAIRASLRAGEGRTGNDAEAIRAERDALWARWTRQAGAGVNAGERARIKAWYDRVTAESIAEAGRGSSGAPAPK